MKGLALLVGEIGAGKTTLARRLLDALPEHEYEAALLVIIHANVTAGWLLRRIALALGVESPAEDKLALLSQLYQRLVRIHEQGKSAVVLIDEAQMLSTRELMEEFRGLLNLEVPERKLLSFVFFGLPEIEDNLRLDPPLAQRVAVRVRLGPLDAAATEAYVRHRLEIAGAPRVPFTADAIAAVHRFTRGTPRAHQHALRQRAVRGPRRAAAAPRRARSSSGSPAELGLDARGGERAPAPAARPAGGSISKRLTASSTRWRSSGVPAWRAHPFGGRIAA